MNKVIKVGQYNVDVHYNVELDDSDESSYDGLVTHEVRDYTMSIKDRSGREPQTIPEADHKVIVDTVEEWLDTEAVDYYLGENV